MEFIVKKFEELSILELYNVLALRNEIFIVEQHCPYQDLDGKDLKSRFVLGYDNNQLIAHCRILPPTVSYEEASIGRVVVKEAYRHQHVGRKMMEFTLNYMTERLYWDKIRISGQAYLKDFYQLLGFVICSDIYLEDNIEHMEMFYSKNK